MSSFFPQGNAPEPEPACQSEAESQAEFETQCRADEAAFAQALRDYIAAVDVRDGAIADCVVAEHELRAISAVIGDLGEDYPVAVDGKIVDLVDGKFIIKDYREIK